MFDHVTEIIAAETIDAVWELHASRMGEFGFDRLICGLCFDTSFERPPSPADMSILSTMPKRYVERLIYDGLHVYAPFSPWDTLRRSVGAWVWDADSTPARSHKERELAALNRQFEVRAGVTIVFGESPPCETAGIVLVARQDMSFADVEALWAKQGQAIRTLSHLAHLRIMSLPRDATSRSLTKRQREVLKLVGDGYTTQVIANRMGLSTVTVEKHLRLARQQLGAGTTAQAVLKAAVLNHIYVSEG